MYSLIPKSNITTQELAEVSQVPAREPCQTGSLQSSDEILCAIDRVRSVQSQWKESKLAQRLQTIGRVAGLIAQHADALAASIVRSAASPNEILASEVLPLAEGCRYVARRGRKVLSDSRLSARDRPWWMGSIRVREMREPFGAVLIIGPSNYPLFLPGVQLIQALAAGNGVLIKPAPGCASALEHLVELCMQAGVPAGLARVLPDSLASAQMAVQAGVDKVVFTGSYEAGRAVARQLADSITPAALELSGNDAVFVLEDADLERVARSVAYALDFNGGQSCIAPRRLFATGPTLERLLPQLCTAIASAQPRAIQAKGWTFAQQAVEEALAGGARLVCGGLTKPTSPQSVTPIVLAGVTSSMRVATDDLFAPVLSVIEVDDMTTALELSGSCRFALGASVFGSADAAMLYAARVPVGCVTVNDVLVPTADPRVSFGGWQSSGYGITRGLEGLREMSRLKVICERRGRWLPHLGTDSARLACLLRGILLLRHGRTLRDRWAGLKLLTKTFSG